MTPEQVQEVIEKYDLSKGEMAIVAMLLGYLTLGFTKRIEEYVQEVGNTPAVTVFNEIKHLVPVL